MPHCTQVTQNVVSLPSTTHHTLISLHRTLIMSNRGRGIGRGRGGSSHGRGGSMKGGAGQAEGDTSPTVHPAYSDDPDADMIIQTTDNVQFEVPSYHLKAARYDILYRGYGGLTRSTFFRSMPTKEDTPLSSAGDADTAVHIEAQSHIFKILLDLVIHTDSTYVNIMNYPSLQC